MSISDETMRGDESLERYQRMETEQARLRERGLGELQEAARHVLWHNGDPRGQEPGSFTAKLLDAWARADTQNGWRLAQVFPALGQAVEISRTRGSDALAAWAGIA